MKMWRPWWSALRCTGLWVRKEGRGRSWWSREARARPSLESPSAARLTLVSASVGVLAGTGYSFYTHYKANRSSHGHIAEQTLEYAFLHRAPDVKAQYKVVHEVEEEPRLVLFQYRTCPFCCKVRAYLDSRGISYRLVEVDAVLRQAIRWSPYKKVPILLAEVDGGYQQLVDSTAIVSILETQRLDSENRLQDLIKFYPMTSYTDDGGKSVTQIVNKYFIMHQSNTPETQKKAEQEERLWRQWADSRLVHVLSPNVYRSLDEALHSFNWFAEVGGWREYFPAWEVSLMVNVGAVAMWLISKRLKARHNLKDDVRVSLYDATREWTKALEKKGEKFLGGSEPNLADLAVYGVLSSIEGCHAFADLRTHTRIASWYDAVGAQIRANRGQVVRL